MPALPDAPNVLRVAYGFHVGSDLGAGCREFFQYTGAAPSAPDLVTLATAIGASATANLIPLMQADTVLETVTITDLTSPTSAEGFALVDENGTRAGGELPADAALLQSLEILRRYRGGHPRTYWPFGTDTDIASRQTWEGAFVTACVDGLAAHFATWSVELPAGMASVTPVNISYYKGFDVVTGSTGRARNVSLVRAAPVIDVVVSSIVRPNIASIRRRLQEPT
jgi:hypothetical protein